MFLEQYLLVFDVGLNQICSAVGDLRGLARRVRRGFPWNDRFIVILRVHHHGGSELLAVAQAGGGPRRFPRLREDREENSSENSVDGDYDDQFDQGKGRGETPNATRS